MDLGLKDAKVIVTAGAAGIGRMIVGRFLAEGARVVTCDIDAADVSRSASWRISWMRASQ